MGVQVETNTEDTLTIKQLDAEVQADINALSPAERAELHAEATRLLEDTEWGYDTQHPWADSGTTVARGK